MDAAVTAPEAHDSRSENLPFMHGLYNDHGVLFAGGKFNVNRFIQRVKRLICFDAQVRISAAPNGFRLGSDSTLSIPGAKIEVPFARIRSNRDSCWSFAPRRFRSRRTFLPGVG